MSGKSIFGSALIIAAIVLAGTFCFSLNPTQAMSENALEEIQAADFSAMMEKEFYSPVISQSDEVTSEAREVLDQVYAENAQCSIQKRSCEAMVAMGYGR